MNIFAMNNTVMYENNDSLCVYKETGKFFVDLKEAGNEVNVFQISVPMGPHDSFANYNIKNKGLNIIEIKRKKYKLLAFIKAFFVGIKWVKKSDFIYIFYPGPICAFIALCSIVLNKRFGLYVRGEQGIKSNISKFLYKKAEVVFTISPEFTDLIRDMGAKEIHTIRPMLTFTEKDIQYHRTYFQKESYNILFVGRIVEDKGIFELIQSISKIKDKNDVQCKLDIIGDGPDLKKARDLVQKLDLSKSVDFHGIISEEFQLSKFYKNSDLFVLPTYHEGFPRVLYEAMIFGVPIATTFVGTIPYLMKDKINCYEIAPKDVSDLSENLYEILRNYETKAVVAINATKTITNYLADKKTKHGFHLNEVLLNNQSNRKFNTISISKR